MGEMRRIQNSFFGGIKIFHNLVVEEEGRKKTSYKLEIDIPVCSVRDSLGKFVAWVFPHIRVCIGIRLGEVLEPFVEKFFW